MNVGQLRGLLEDLDDETEVMIASQPSWPMAHYATRAELVGCDEDRIEELRDSLAGVDESDLSTAEEVKAHDDLRRELQDLERDGNQKQVLWIAEGSQPYPDPYLPSIVCQKLGWR